MTMMVLPAWQLMMVQRAPGPAPETPTIVSILLAVHSCEDTAGERINGLQAGRDPGDGTSSSGLKPQVPAGMCEET
jgi:hypothetical protein